MFPKGQSQAFCCAYGPGIISNKWPSLRKLKISEEAGQTPSELYNLLLQSWALSFQRKKRLENERTCGLRSESLQQQALLALLPVEQDKKPEPATTLGRAVNLGFLS